ncbi:MAG: SwmB domain-containing protein, partial [Rhodococcus sp.]|nr:SwmB domain-containing protein [Rhodococcus sp. (in: high G+C Gram-positive bacteria)]
MGYAPGANDLYGYSEDASIGDVTVYGFSQGTQDNYLEEASITETTGSDTVFVQTDLDMPVNSVADLGGTTFTMDAAAKTVTDGLYQWVVPSGFGMVVGQKMTVGLNLAPVLIDAEVDGSSLVLTYAEDLKITQTPDGSDFLVTVDSGTPVAAMSAGVSGPFINVVLATAVTAGQTVTVSYTPGTNPIQDASGIKAVAFTDHPVTNNTGATNTPATGAPVISGAPQVDETLTAGAGNIADDDDLPTTTFPTGYSFQWVRVDSSDNESDITGATSRTYTPVTADVGNTLKVKVSFTDGGNTVETATSDAYPSQGYPSTAISIVAAKTACPSDEDWCSEITVGYGTGSADYYGYSADLNFGDTFSFLISQGAVFNDFEGAYITDSTGNDRVTFETSLDIPVNSVVDFGGTPFTIDAVARGNTGVYRWSVPSGFGMMVGQKMTMSLNLAPFLTGASVNGNQLVLTYSEDFDLSGVPSETSWLVKIDSNAGVNPTGTAYTGSTVTLTLPSAVTAGQTVTVSYTVPVFDPLQDESGIEAAAFTDEPVTNNTGATANATGAPEITGPAQAGRTLTAGKGTIEDTDGLPSTTFPTGYSFQWVRVETNSEDDISGATSATYTPVFADEGRPLKVRVSFTDGGGETEMLTSAETNPVVPDAASCPAGSVWCTVLTSGTGSSVDEDSPTVGFDVGDALGSLGDDTFTFGGTTYTVTSLNSIGAAAINLKTTPLLPASGGGLTLHGQKVT